MKLRAAMKIIAILELAATALCGNYTLRDNIIGSGFYSAFTFPGLPDPSNGRVNYVDQATAQILNLSYASDNTFILRADSWTVLDPNGPGRNSFRLESVNTYTTSVLVFDIRHMPEGCGTWPAIWTVDKNSWPNAGEIDIIEGINNQSPNSVTLHTTAGCTMPPSRRQLGTAGQLDCNYEVNGDTGCIVKLPTQQSFGPQFNSIGGGWYAMERTDTDVQVWFWPRNSGIVPFDVTSGALYINTTNWGTPDADFPNTFCDIARYFDAHQIIINLTFCGGWAGGFYSQAGCPGTCIDYVNNNPSAFVGAYFDFASLKIYE